jgi:hypothetical protein
METIDERIKKEIESANTGWLVDSLEARSQRYQEAEGLLLDLLGMPWYKRAFTFKRIFTFLKGRNKYKF